MTATEADRPDEDRHEKGAGPSVGAGALRLVAVWWSPGRRRVVSVGWLAPRRVSTLALAGSSRRLDGAQLLAGRAVA